VEDGGVHAVGEADRPAAVAASLVHGCTTAFAFSAFLLAIGVVATVLLVRAGRNDLPAEGAVALA
jgi:hypothetical protein